MRSKSVALLLADLGVTKTHSRPHVSNDNPYSESQFKTLKYCPQFPRRFGSIEDARLFSRNFFDYYNHEHRHSGIGLMSTGRSWGIRVALKRSAQLDDRFFSRTYQVHPERFVRGNASTSRFTFPGLDQPSADKNNAPLRPLEPLSREGPYLGYRLFRLHLTAVPSKPMWTGTTSRAS